MMKRFTLFTIAFSFLFGVKAEIQDGHSYYIAMESQTNKSLYVSDYQSGSPYVVMRTSADIPTQQWMAVKNDDGTFTFLNDYIGTRLCSRMANLAEGMNIMCKFTTTQPSCKWTLKAKAEEQEENVYSISREGFYITSSDTTNGSRPKLSQSESFWRFIEVEDPVRTSVAKARDRMIRYWLKENLVTKSLTWVTLANGGWSEAEMMEVLLDAYEATGNEEWKTTFTKMYRYFRAKVGSKWDGWGPSDYGWYGAEYNDDVAWMVIAAARAGILFNNKNYILDAQRNWDIIYNRAYNSYCGLIRWVERDWTKHPDDQYRYNSCVNGPMEVAACYIGEGLNLIGMDGEPYFEKAKNLYANQRSRLAKMENGHVYDCRVILPSGTVDMDKSNNWASTYNQGTMMGAAVLLYKHTGETKYKTDAQIIMKYVDDNLCNTNDIIKVCQDDSNGDLMGFKGILMRYVHRLVVDGGDTKWNNWLRKNAWTAYLNSNSDGVCHTGWLTKTPENTKFKAFNTSCAVSAMMAVVLTSEETGIRNVLVNTNKDNQHPDAIYNLSGQKVSESYKGIVIKNGRKYRR